jgi:ABC-type oligopeptide transport system substrate-binding subunit
MTMKRTALAILVLSLAVLSCSFFSSSPTPVPEATDTPESSDTPTCTPTQTALPTSTPTATPTQTPTATPSPSPTPQGFYRSNDLGISFTIPEEWFVDTEGPGYIVFGTGYVTVNGYLESRFRSGDLTSEEYAQYTAEDLMSFLEVDSYQISQPEPVNLDNSDLTAEKYTITITDNLDWLRIWFVIVEAEGRYFQLLLMGPINTVEELEPRTLDFVNTFAFFQPQPSDLPPETTLYQLGRDPDENDIDPARTTGSAAGYPGLLFAGLVALKPDLTIIPDLALEWKVTEGGTVYTFTLREDIHFASGDPITANDVKASWERAADPDTDSSTAMTYLGDILGVPEKLAGEADEIPGVVVIDERTLQVTLDGPKPYFLAKLTYPTSFIVDVAQIESDPDWWLDPNASGPYLLSEYEENNLLVFEANPTFYAPAAIPHLLYDLSPGGTQISLFETGELDVAYIRGEDVLRLQDENEPLREFLHSTTTVCTDMIKFDNTLPPFDDINVRKAFTLAIDQNAVNEQFSEGLDRVAIGLLPPAMPGFTPENAIATSNQQAAQDALAESDYAGDMPEIVISAWGYGDTDSPYVAMLVDMWQTTLGVDITVEYIEPDRFTEIAREEHGQMVVYGWCADYPDPQNFLEVLFHTESDFNVSGYTNPDFDALVEEAATAPDPSTRIALYQEAEQLLLKDFAFLPMSHNVAHVLISNKIQDFTFSPTSNVYVRWLTLDVGD